MMKLFKLFLLPIVVLALLGTPLGSLAQTDQDQAQDALNQIRESRGQFKNSKSEELRETGQAKREEARQRMEDKRKEVLLRLIDIRVKQLNRMNDRVQRMPNITDELKTQLATEILSQIQALEGQKANVEGAEGREAIKALAAELRSLFQSKRGIIKGIVEAIHASRVEIAAAKAQERAAKIGEKLEELAGEGQDTTELEADLDAAEQDIENAKEKIGKKEFKEGAEDLKGAYQKFRGIAEKAKGLG